MGHEWMAALTEPDTYDERTRHVQLLETHISRVFLTDHHVYKMKKNVRFEFLDFSSIERRRAACEAELILNRRLAPEVYLAVLPVVKTSEGRIRVGGDGTVMDWFVKMRRLADDTCLEHLISVGTVTKLHAAAIGERLSEFYRGLAPLRIDPDDYRVRMAQHIRANEFELNAVEYDLDEVRIRRVHEAQLRYVVLETEELDRRVRDGRIVEGHGDLRPEHIYLCPEVVVIDCIEFNREFREIDIVDELSFLAMECAERDARWIGELICDTYRKRGQDDFPDRLQQFYKAYRASVRAKVAALRSQQLNGDDRRVLLDEAARYLALAYAEVDGLGRPLCLVVSGASGTGKSTVAHQLSQQLEIEVVSTDAVRREWLGGREQPVPFGEGIYEESMRDQVYTEVFRRASVLLADRLSVVMDGTFLQEEHRHHVSQLAAERDAVLVVLNCTCPTELAQQRIDRRLRRGDSTSDARPEIHERQRAKEVPWCDARRVRQVDTSGLPDEILAASLAHIRELWHQSNAS